MDPKDATDKSDLEWLPPTGDDTGDSAAESVSCESAAAASKPRGRNAVLAGGAVVLIAGAAVFGVRAASGGKAGATSNTVATNGAPNQSLGGNGPGNFGSRFGGGAFGTISAINGSTVTVKGNDGTTTKVATSSRTTVTKSASSSVGAIAVGDHVTVIGSGSTSIAAQRITDTGATDLGDGFAGPPGGARTNGNGNGQGPSFNGGPPPGAGSGNAPATSFAAQRGTVKSISGSTITLATASGSTVTVTTSSSTAVTRTTNSSVSALSVGDSVVATGTTKNGTLTATSIREGDAGGFGGFGQGFNGTPPTTGGQTS